MDVLNRYEIPLENSAILVRTQNAKRRLVEGTLQNCEKHPIISSIQLWQRNEPAAQQYALKLLAQQLQKWIGFRGRESNYYFSNEICSNCMEWRLLLRNILLEFTSDSIISDMNRLKYGEWYRRSKAQIVTIINRKLRLERDSLTSACVRTPSGTSGLTINSVNGVEESDIKVETIHAVKGKTFDAILLLSAPNGNGRTGYWENWLNFNDEAGRIAYVASTRPRYLLCWGVKKLSDEQRSRIEEIGFNKIISD